MDETVMTNGQLRILQQVAQGMGLRLDELGHPYREIRKLVNGVDTLRIVDFDPYNDPADGFRVQKAYNLALEFENALLVVREGKGPILNISGLDTTSEESEMRDCLLSIVEAASKLLTRRERRASAEG